jgi:hypothetical protein
MRPPPADFKVKAIQGLGGGVLNRKELCAKRRALKIE